MNETKEFLHIKILAGYFIVLVVVGSMSFILLREYQRMQDIDSDLITIGNVRNCISTVHRHITELAFDGETVIGWDEEDYEKYHTKRICVDSLLQELHINCVDYLQPEQINTLRQLLADKEKYLLHIMLTFRKQKEADSVLVQQLPAMLKQVNNVCNTEDILHIDSQTNKLHALNNQFAVILKERERVLSVHIDSLAVRNMELNRQFMELILTLDNQLQVAFADKEQQLFEMRQTSFHLIAYVLISAMLLLLVSYFIIHRDIRQKTRDRQKMVRIINENRKLLEMRKNIILTVSHDIRGPLGNINNSAELAMDTREKKKRNAYLENIRISCRHILHLVNNLLDVYRMNERKDTRNDVPFRLDRMLERVVGEYSRKSNDKGLLFIPHLLGLGITVKGDADRIEQILDNLLVNAIKFTKAGEVHFLAAYENERLTIEIRDTGIGMTEETLNRIFKPFERAAQEINSEGFGLGLTITKGLVGLLGGDISVKSTVGKGSTFRVVLPLARTEEVEREENKSVSENLRLPHQVLIVDDDPVQLEVIKEMLERSGVFCEACSNVKEVVHALRKQNFDLILTDVQMPGTDGFNLLRLLRNSKIGTSQTVPVMVMTARGDKETYNFTEAGFLDCIYKPFSTKELLSFISSVVRQENEENNTVSFETLTSEANDKHKILELFIRESERSIAELQDALEMADRNGLRETMHRMLPLWEMVHAAGTLQAYGRILHDENTNKKVLREETERIVAYTHELIAKANEEIAKLKDGTEDIDS